MSFFRPSLFKTEKKRDELFKKMEKKRFVLDRNCTTDLWIERPLPYPLLHRANDEAGKKSFEVEIIRLIVTSR